MTPLATGDLAWLRGGPAPPSVPPVHVQADAWAISEPGRVAAVDRTALLTYRDVLGAAHALASRLRREGVRRGCLVPVCVAPSARAAQAFLGVLLTGAAYVPIDPELPRARQELLFAESGSAVLVTDQASDPGPGPWATTVLADRPRSHGPRVVTTTHPGDLAYVIYTSGTTGTPKGVAVTHEGLAAIVRETQQLFGLGAGARVVQQTSLSFDPSVVELFLALTSGGTLVHVAKDQVLAAGGLERAIGEHRAEVLIGTPTVARLLDPRRVPALKCMTFGGEALAPRTARAWAEGRRVFNVYGPSEATVFSTAHRCRADEDGAVAIGTPLPGREIVVVDDDLWPVARGETGEICIGGLGLARGYWERPELTRERFVELGARGVPGRFYRSGDLGRVGSDGELQFLGRADRQVKVRGHRIELEEIEHVLGELPGVSEAAVLLHDGALAAYVVTAADLDADHLRRELAAQLPAHMLPRHVIGVERLPRTTNGKVAMNDLPLPTSSAATASTPAAAKALQALLLSLFADVLQRDDVGPDDRLFDVGGDSMDAVQIIASAAEIGIAITPRMIYDRQSPAALAAALAAA